MSELNSLIGLCQRARFLISASTVAQCPPDSGDEVAFAGRSNAGKSSALNTLTHAHLARTSKTPGRTQLMNFFSLDDTRRLVDLPGYGYAKVPIPLKLHWQQHLEAYLSRRRCLRLIVLVMDIRHPLMPFDELLLDWARHSGMPVHMLLTKADKLTPGQARQACAQVQARLKAADGVPSTFSLQTFSAVRRQGLDEAYAVLAKHLSVE